MGLYAGVCLVFGLDITKGCPTDIHELTEGTSGVECTAPDDGACAILYASASYLSLLSHKTVEVPVLDVAQHAASVDAAPLVGALRAFCEVHSIPWTEPRWLIVSDVS